MSKTIKVSALEKHPDYTRALGMISAEVGVLELMLGEMLGAILGIPRHIGQTIYLTPQSYIGRLEILENVIGFALKPDAPGTHKILGFIKRTKKRIQYRNDAIHSVWGIAKSDHTVVTKRSVPLLPDKPAVIVKLPELYEEIQKLRALTDEVEFEIKSLTRQRKRFFASLDKSRKRGLRAHKPKAGRASRET